ncbi:MAG: SMC-Scp complex subunit ScpB [Phycisphaerae bacterium]|nr:SMC-Scp complex subunit ScpB [Phycisphaerae bacterium]
MRLVREVQLPREDSEMGFSPPRGACEIDIADGAVEEAPGCPSEVAGQGPETVPAVDLRALEALLFSTHHPLTPGRLAEMLGLDSTRPIRAAVRELNRTYAETGRAFRIEQVAGGYQMLTLPEFGELLRKLHQREADARLSKAAMETLAIIAYKQPILRAEIEAIRGVACGETIRNLMEKHLVKIAGRAEEPGRPILYGTTRRFLEVFGLNSLKDLPQPDNGAAAGLSELPNRSPERLNTSAEAESVERPVPESAAPPAGPRPAAEHPATGS